jgi:cephalosporin hydroxylase
MDERRMVDDFHGLYYNNASRTWQNTRWLGAQVLKCPLDLWIYQEILFEVRPDVIVESGTFGGGSAYFFASLCDLLGKGSVITIDIAPLSCPEHPRITYLKGSSVSSEMLGAVRTRISPEDKVLVILDSNHSEQHVLEEMQLYAPLVTSGSYLIVEDGNINGHPVALEHGPGPTEALTRFFATSDDFEVDREREKFFMTFNPNGYLRKK